MAAYNYPKMNWQEIKRSLTFILPLMVFIAIGPFAMVYAMVPEYLPWAFVAFVVIILIGIILGIFNRPRYQIIIENDELIFNRPGKLPTTISRTAITSITEVTERGLTIDTGNSESHIFIPTNINGYQSIYNELNSWHPILQSTGDDKSQLWIALAIITLSGVSAIGAFVFRIKILFYVFIASFILIATIQGINVFKHKPQSESKKPLQPIHRIILGFVILYFIYRIIVSFS